MHEDSEVLGSAAGGDWSARSEERAKNLRERVKEQKIEREIKDLRRKDEEKKLVDEYMQFVEREKAAKKEEIRSRLERLKAKKKNSFSDVGAASCASIPGPESPSLVHTGAQTSHALARSQFSGLPSSEPGENASQAIRPQAGNGSPSAEGVVVESSEAGTQEPLSAAGNSPKTSAGKRPPKGVVSRRRDADAVVRVDEKVAKLNESLGFRPMLNALERIDANDKGSAFRKLPKMQPITQKAPDGGDSEGRPDGKDEEHYLRSQRHLARRQRLRLMNQVASEVLKGKKQLVHCFQQADFPSRAMMFSA